MRLIFSRKGFDSQYGGVPSPIFPDGSFLSIPIPSQEDARHLGDVCHGDINIGDLVADLTNNRINRHSRVHFDPDLHGPTLERSPGWLPAFGQIAAAQSHLENQGVGEGDLFLFFGWFRKVEYFGGHWRYVPRSPDFHSIFGWLQIGKVVRMNDRGEDVAANYPWLRSHPHVLAAARFVSKNNAIYLATDALHLGRTPLELTGGGVFRKFSPNLLLTAEGSSRSLWRLPAWFSPEGRLSGLSYHGNPSRWTRQDNSTLLQTVAKGQEFVLDCEHYPESKNWLAGLFAPVALDHVEEHP